MSGDLSIWHSSPISVSERLDFDLPPLVLSSYVLWFLMKKKCLTLAENPQFYPEEPAYESDCDIWPAANLGKSRKVFYVLTNTNKRRVVLESTDNWKSFDNVWRREMDRTLIFKSTYPGFPFLSLTDIFPDTNGHIEGEARVEQTIDDRQAPQPCSTHTSFCFEQLRRTEWKGKIHHLLNLDESAIHSHLKIVDDAHQDQ